MAPRQNPPSSEPSKDPSSNSPLGTNHQTKAVLRSFPALAAQFHTLQRSSPHIIQPPKDEPSKLVQAYTIQSYPQIEDEAKAAAHVVQHILERMRRLARAYGEWQTFEPSAYFDLNKRQCAQLIHLEERVSTVYCTFYADPLLPSFQAAAGYFEQSFLPGYWQRQSGIEMAEHFFSALQPAMVEHWLRLQKILMLARSQLAMEISFLAMNAAEEERWVYREAWNESAPAGLDERLLPPLRMIPSLTLSHEFPLPAYRQPGRKRRLWYNRERKRLFGRGRHR